MLDQIRQTVTELVKAALGHIDTYALYEGTVVQQHSDLSLDVKPDTSRWGDGPVKIPIAYGLPGVTAKVPAGTRVAFGFHDGHRDRPYVRHFLGGTPVEIVINADAVKLGTNALQGVARLGDTAGPYLITSASLKVKAE